MIQNINHEKPNYELCTHGIHINWFIECDICVFEKTGNLPARIEILGLLEPYDTSDMIDEKT